MSIISVSCDFTTQSGGIWGFHHPGENQAAFLTGLAHLYNLIPYQRRAKNAGLCGVEVEGGRVPTSDWMLNLQILTSGGYQYALEPPYH
jgi:hypothetical protein